MNHVHVSTLSFLTFAAYAVIFGFLWNAAAARFALNDEGSFRNRLGQAMAFIGG